MGNILPFVIFWGVWLLVPILVDAFITVASFFGVLIMRWRRTLRRQQLLYPPFVSLLIPVYNSSDTLLACLHSVAAQDYPLDRMEIILIDNGSRDDSFAIFSNLSQELNLQISWHAIINQGKAWALNAGIHLAHGDYIFNIDSDVVLAPDAVRNVVEAMEAEPDLSAVTGSIEVLPPSSDAPLIQRILGECEFFEYLSAFHVGREHQTLLQSLYTLAGAFSVFRRDILLQTFLYSQETVTEDTDMTFELYERFRDRRIGCVSTAVAYVHPIESLRALYAQRVRWQRGQIEVSARHEKLMRRPIWQLRGITPARTLAIDHTLAFPRLVWTFLLPILTLFDYPLSLIVLAAIGLYIFYMVIDLIWTAVAWLNASSIVRRRLLRVWWLLPILPLYRMLVFWFRFSGFLTAVAEPGVWRVQDPVTQVQAGWQDLQQRAIQFYRNFRSTRS